MHDMNLTIPATFTPPTPRELKPHSDSWQVGQRTFASTRDLVAHAHELDGQQAVYRFKEVPDPPPFTPSERLRNVVGGALTGAVAGAGAGALVGGGLTLLVGLADLLNQAITYAPGNPVTASLVLVPALAGAALGAAAGVGEGWRHEPGQPPREISGRLESEGGKLSFYPEQRLDRKVDLSAYQDAGQAAPTAPEPQNALWNTVKGAAVGAALVPAQMIPLVGIAAPVVVGSAVGQALDRRTLLGEGLGVFAGAGLMVGGLGLIISGVVSPSAVALGAAGGLGLAGAALGHKVFSSLADQERPAYQYGEQWWNR